MVLGVVLGSPALWVLGIVLAALPLVILFIALLPLFFGGRRPIEVSEVPVEPLPLDE